MYTLLTEIGTEERLHHTGRFAALDAEDAVGCRHSREQIDTGEVPGAHPGVEDFTDELGIGPVGDEAQAPSYEGRFYSGQIVLDGEQPLTDRFSGKPDEQLDDRNELLLFVRRAGGPVPEFGIVHGLSFFHCNQAADPGAHL
ncbi:MAG: hypothetical protein BWY96_02988 [Spirochaetes bacterium ADurb.BinA120]|nr:MAG: hypothetical protein BWY96_02988 [Spirochaetes bacterium ADurb.BinA120]